MVGHWKFDEGTGVVAVDSSVSSNNGSLRNMTAVDWVDGKFGKALDFDGGNDYVLITGYKGITGSSPSTMSAWIKTQKQDAAILSWGNNIAGEKWNFRTQTGNGNLGALRVEVNGGYRVGKLLGCPCRGDKHHLGR